MTNLSAATVVPQAPKQDRTGMDEEKSSVDTYARSHAQLSLKLLSFGCTRRPSYPQTRLLPAQISPPPGAIAPGSKRSSDDLPSSLPHCISWRMQLSLEVCLRESVCQCVDFMLFK
eukprot:1157118-Pelagomonas_calceolata.AAC.18